MLTYLTHRFCVEYVYDVHHNSDKRNRSPEWFLLLNHVRLYNVHWRSCYRDGQTLYCLYILFRPRFCIGKLLLRHSTVGYCSVVHTPHRITGTLGNWRAVVICRQESSSIPKHPHLPHMLPLVPVNGIGDKVLQVILPSRRRAGSRCCRTATRAARPSASSSVRGLSRIRPASRPKRGRCGRPLARR